MVKTLSPIMVYGGNELLSIHGELGDLTSHILGLVVGHVADALESSHGVTPQKPPLRNVSRKIYILNDKY